MNLKFWTWFKRQQNRNVEQAKISATFVNNIAAAFIISGVIAPFFLVLYGINNVSAEQARYFVFGTPLWAGFGGALHFAARRIVKGL